MKVPITHSDGMGIMLDKPTRMCRLPFVKGLMVYFPFDKFIKEKCPGGRAIVTDIYGEEHDILKEDIRYIFTKSQFKLASYYANWQCYKAQFKGNNCEACYCNIEEDEIPKSRINYQMLQTLTDMSDKEIEILTKKTIEEINAIGNDYQTTMKLLGATDYNKNPSYFQQALMIYPELFKDHYCRDILKQTKKSLVKQAKAGRLRVNGGYYFVVPDLYAFCENLFLGAEQPAGLLKNGEVYIKEFSPNSELACLRSPHLYREWPIRINNRNEETDKWLGGTKCLYISTYDLISKIVQCDFDGDKVLVIKDKNLTAVAKRNMEKIVPLDYKLGKANSHFINSEVLYEGMSNSYTGGNIGPISNQISRVWNLENIDEEKINTVKWLCYINNQVIDYAKTLWKVEPPKDIQEIIKKHTKGNLPNFFIYAKDKTESQVEPPNSSTMNRIAASIPSPLIKFNKNIGKFDYRMLMNLKSDFSLLENSSVIKSYDYWNTHQYLFNTEGIDGVRQEDLYMFQEIRKRIINETGKSLDYIVNTLVAYLYTVRPSSQKKMLWACFGDVIVENLKKNTTNLGKICSFCGKRFQPQKINQRYCSNECYSEAHLQQIKNWKSYQMVD